MPKGQSLHIGLNSVNPKHYEGWSGPLTACEADANDMEALAKSRGFKTKKLLTKTATRKAVLSAIQAAAKALAKGDIFFLTYSGHGGQLPDSNEDEPDGLDETWCLFDGELIDDEIFHAFGAFKPDVRIVMLSDSCHSGSVAKNLKLERSLIGDDNRRFRAMPRDKAMSVFQAHRAFYEKIQAKKGLDKAEDSVKAGVILISGCQDNQLSSDGTFNGAFTGRLKAVWNGGKFKGDYRAFHKKIVAGMPDDQTPNYFKAGNVSAKFEKQAPFLI